MFTSARSYLPIFSALAALFLFGCEDLLPDHRPPENLFAPSIAEIDTSTVVYHETDGYYKGLFTSYNFFKPDSFVKYVLADGNPAYAGRRRTMMFNVYLVNTYEEPLQGTANVQGEIVLWPTNNPAKSATMTLSNSSISSPHLYSPSTGIITIAPGERLYLSAFWDLRFNDGQWLHTAAAASGQRVITSKLWALTYDPLPLSGRMTVRLFSSVNMEVLGFSFVVPIEGHIYTIGP